jgi:hypothetical protein
VAGPDFVRYWKYTSIAVVLLIILTTSRLLLAWWKSPAERPRAAGLLLTTLSLLVVGLAVGVGRSGFGPGFGFASRYIPIAAPILVSLYVTWIVYGRGRTGRVIQLSLFVLVCLSLPSNNQLGRVIGKTRRDFLRQVEYGLKIRVPGPRLVAVTGKGLQADLGILYDCMHMLKTGGIGDFPRFEEDRSVRGDIDGDGQADIINGGEPGSAANVRVLSGADGAVLADFPAYPGFGGGVHVAAGDIDGDGRADIVTGAGAGGGPHVRAFRGVDGTVLADFLAFDPGFAAGVHVATGDLDGDGRAEIITVGGPGGGQQARVFHVEGGSTRLAEGEVIRLRDRRRPDSEPDPLLSVNRKRDGRSTTPQPAEPKTLIR